MMKPLMTKNTSTPTAPKFSSVPPASTVSNPSRVPAKSTACVTTTAVAAANRSA